MCSVDRAQKYMDVFAKFPGSDFQGGPSDVGLLLALTQQSGPQAQGSSSCARGGPEAPQTGAMPFLTTNNSR